MRDPYPWQPDVTRLCAWCENPIPARARRDAVCCPVRCRQARHRFLRAVGYAESVAPGRPLRLAYADPPYPGKARLYRDHRDYGGEVNHAVLIERLSAYDGWALSTSAEALPGVLALCPPGIRVAAWHKGERVTRSRYPLNAWEPVIYHGGRQLPCAPRRADSIVCGVTPVSTRPGHVIGAKPAAVCRWIFTPARRRTRGTPSMTCSPAPGPSPALGPRTRRLRPRVTDTRRLRPGPTRGRPRPRATARTRRLRPHTTPVRRSRPRLAPSSPAAVPVRRPSPHRTDCCRSIRRSEGVKDRFACTLTRHFHLCSLPCGNIGP